MRVLLVSGSLPPLPCGVGDYTLRLARALAKCPGVEVAVLTSRGADENGAGAVEICPVMPAWGLAEAPLLMRRVRDWRPDVVHVQYPTQGYRLGMLPAFIPLMSAGAGIWPARTWHEIPGLLGGPHFVLEATAPGPYVVVRPEFEHKLHPWLKPLIAGRAGGYIAGASAIPRSTGSPEELQCLRARFLNGRRRLIVFFGFLYPAKRAELLFDIANPETDAIVIAGNAGVNTAYRAELQRLADSARWRGGATLTGYLSDTGVADLLAAADAVVLPFAAGGGVWNSSIAAAVLQGTPVVTTSENDPGFDEKQLIYSAPPGDVADMRVGLDRLAGKRRSFDLSIDRDEWAEIAERHVALYRERR